MKRLALLTGLMTMAMSGTALADAAAFCTSICASQQRECRASAESTTKFERLPAPDASYRNPLAHTAQGEVPGMATRALDAAGDGGRRQARFGGCEASYQRCTRSCAVQSDTVKKPADK